MNEEIMFEYKNDFLFIWFVFNYDAQISYYLYYDNKIEVEQKKKKSLRYQSKSINSDSVESWKEKR